MKKPASVRGHRWTIWKRVDIEDVSQPTEIYLTRWIILLTPFFGIYLHKINRPDGDRNLHDHPWSFLSVVLRGGYTETVSRTPEFGASHHTRTWGRLSVHRIMRGTYHRIVHLARVPTWSLCLVGPRRGDWGFYEPGRGWVQWEEYLDENFDGWAVSKAYYEKNGVWPDWIHAPGQDDPRPFAPMDAVLDRRHPNPFPTQESP